METPGQTITPLPSQTLSPRLIGCALPALPSRFRLERMGRRHQLDRRAELTVAADADAGHVEHDAVVVHEGARADRDLAAVVAAEARLDHDVVAYRLEELAQDLRAERLLGMPRRVVPLEQRLCARVVGRELRVARLVGLPAQHPPLHLAHGPSAAAAVRNASSRSAYPGARGMLCPAPGRTARSAPSRRSSTSHTASKAGW